MVGRKKIERAAVYAILALMPLGQIPGIFIKNAVGSSFRLHPIDFLVLFLAIIGFSRKPEFLRVVYVAVFSFLLSLGIFELRETVISSAYLIRFIAYLGFFRRELKFQRERERLIKYLIWGSVVAALLGWVQYIMVPDMRWLRHYGWDDHYYRMVGTILDPAFLGIYLVMAILSALVFFESKKKRVSVTLFLAISLAFSYSRASFLALAMGLGYYYWKKRERGWIRILLAVFALTVALLPRPGGYGVKLERTHSMVQKAENFKHGVVLFEKSPLFGVGYNNVCAAKSMILLRDESGSNSCHGFDNSLLFIAVSMGVIGFIVFGRFLVDLWNAQKGEGGLVLRALMLGVGIHGMFTNTLFYPWVMIWLAIVNGGVLIAKEKK